MSKIALKAIRSTSTGTPAFSPPLPALSPLNTPPPAAKLSHTLGFHHAGLLWGQRHLP